MWVFLLCIFMLACALYLYLVYRKLVESHQVKPLFSTLYKFLSLVLRAMSTVVSRLVTMKLVLPSSRIKDMVEYIGGGGKTQYITGRKPISMEDMCVQFREREEVQRGNLVGQMCM